MQSSSLQHHDCAIAASRLCNCIIATMQSTKPVKLSNNHS